VDLLILIVTCAVILTLGLFVLLRDVRKIYNRLFIWVTIFISLWIITNYITNHYTTNLDITNIANKLTFMTGYGLLFTELLFTYFFPVRRRIKKPEIIAVGIIGIMMFGLSLLESVTGVATLDENGHLAFSIGELTWLYILGFIVTIVLVVKNLVRLPHKASAIRVRQARLILVAFATTAFAGIMLNVVVPIVTNDWNYTRFTPVATIIMVAIIAYTIIRHGLFDIRLAVVRGVGYVFSLATLGVVYYLLIYAVSHFLLQDQAVTMGYNALYIGLALIIAFIFQPVKLFFDRVTSKIFYRDDYSVEEFLERLGRELSATSDLQDLLERASREISATIHTEQCFFFVRYGEKNHVNAGLQKRHLLLEDIQILDEYQNKQRSSRAIVDDLLDENDPVHRMFKKYTISLALPLAHGATRPSYLFLGHKRSRNFNQKDIRTLETISDELVIAIQNALSVQEVKEINDTLQQRIDDATKELRKTNEQLQKLDAAKDEFVSMASHQLRTPLTSIKGYISMVLEGDVGKITPTQHQMLSEAFTSSERMVHLIGDFLNVSRLQTGKFMLEDKPVDLSKLVAQEIDSLQTTIEAHGLKLQYHKPSYFPVLMLDEGKIRQVLMNFIDNAIFYSPEGKTISVKLSVEEGFAVVRVIDAGIGVPKSEQAHLFTKFFRASNARKQRPDGTGVGLFLAKKVIAAHGGTMLFESEEGKGSTFGFRLPIKKLQASEKDIKTSAGNGAYQLKK